MGSLRRRRAKQISLIFSQSYWIGKLEDTSGILMRSGNENWKNYFIFSLKERAREECHLPGFQRQPTKRGQITAEFFRPQLRCLWRKLSDNSGSDVTSSYTSLPRISISSTKILVRMYYYCSLNCLPLQWVVRLIRQEPSLSFLLLYLLSLALHLIKGWCSINTRYWNKWSK